MNCIKVHSLYSQMEVSCRDRKPFLHQAVNMLQCKQYITGIVLCLKPLSVVIQGTAAFGTSTSVLDAAFWQNIGNTIVIYDKRRGTSFAHSKRQRVIC